MNQATSTKKFKKGDEVICVNATGTRGITVGNAYRVGGSGSWHNGAWIDVCDDNESAEYLESRFRLKTAEDTAVTKVLPAMPGAKGLADLLRGKVRNGTHPSNTRAVVAAADALDELRAALEIIAMGNTDPDAMVKLAQEALAANDRASLVEIWRKKMKAEKEAKES